MMPGSCIKEGGLGNYHHPGSCHPLYHFIFHIFALCSPYSIFEHVHSRPSLKRPVDLGVKRGWQNPGTPTLPPLLTFTLSPCVPNFISNHSRARARKPKIDNLLVRVDAGVFVLLRGSGEYKCCTCPPFVTLLIKDSDALDVGRSSKGCLLNNHRAFISDALLDMHTVYVFLNVYNLFLLEYAVLISQCASIGNMIQQGIRGIGGVRSMGGRDHGVHTCRDVLGSREPVATVFKRTTVIEENTWI